MGSKIDDLLSAMKLGELVRRKDPMEKRRHTLMCVLAIIGAVAAVAAIAYAVYRYMNPDYLDDFDDDFDDYEDDFDEIDLSVDTPEGDPTEAESTSAEDVQ
ncbi:MAG: DUF4366 domain-containing protein [Clostridiales bacterium]|mgnify:CR=1 FL=1|nr:DUF4366 domain-containing protein [Clostridiales bacterium]